MTDKRTSLLPIVCGLWFGLCGPLGCTRSPVPSQTSLPGTPKGGTSARTEPKPSSASGRKSSPEAGEFRFAEVAIASGIDFTYRNGQEAAHCAILESLGGGIAVLDYDGDGEMDVFAAGGGEYAGDMIRGRPPGLFRNIGGWQFKNVSHLSHVDLAPFFSHGAIVGDFDNDGFADVLVTGYGGLQLFHNLGDGCFAEVSQACGLTDDSWSSSAGWGDVDRDGDLDLYVAHYVDWSWKNHPFCKGPLPDTREVCPPRRFAPLPDVLYENLGDGSFRDASQSAGLRADGKGLGVVVADMDLDGWLDIYVANDTVDNFMYRNLGGGKFEDVGVASGTGVNDMGTPDGSMGVDVGDYNSDGRPDLWVANFERESFALYRNDGNWAFQHVSHSTGVTALGGLFVGWGTLFLDADLDGNEDLFVSNGHVVRYPTNAPVLQQPLLLQNLQGKRFVNVGASAGAYFNQPHMGRGVAAGDLDHDGDIDLAITHTNERVAVLRNESRNSHHWLALRLIGTRSSRIPIGTVAHLTTKERKQTRQLKGGASYASTSEYSLLFGLGKNEMIQQVEIRWPSGRRQILSDVRADQAITIVENGRRS